MYVREKGGRGVPSGIVNLVCTFGGKLISWHLAELSPGIQSLLRPEVGRMTTGSLTGSTGNLESLAGELWARGPCGVCWHFPSAPSLVNPGPLHSHQTLSSGVTEFKSVQVLGEHLAHSKRSINACLHGASISSTKQTALPRARGPGEADSAPELQEVPGPHPRSQPAISEWRRHASPWAIRLAPALRELLAQSEGHGGPGGGRGEGGEDGQTDRQKLAPQSLHVPC